MIIGFLKIAFLLGFLIFIHEAGHFTVAKLFNVKVNKFALGFGPTLLKKKIGETSYELKAIPLGGFVDMLGENEPVEDERAYNKKKKWQRVCILLAGGMVNIIFGVILCVIIASTVLGLKGGVIFTGKIQKEQLVGVVRNIRYGSWNKWF